MSTNRRTYDREFREGAVRIVLESGRPIAAVARDLGVFVLLRALRVNGQRHDGPVYTLRGDCQKPDSLRSPAAAPHRPEAVNGQFVVPAGGQLKVPTLRWVSVVRWSGSSFRSGLSHPVGLAVGDDGVAVVQEPVEEADGGGVFGEETSGPHNENPQALSE